ncbi:hypothetical protein CEUSTIGMA_g2239.t1 [Chlamydomonas eustigma]|uniref:protein-serine/threonine phosphatase n=1 Tax=Chlamydomonas eustigma TaxID=1157962 RepID=A0A250WVZ4_9CHLO|nr:hypothetical protein CEUSTIGMA_g2239.t1 [Chlamydomonas eustigma]|eukprot:GAX74792.1 hypothetical protein CEUSTIGMA_g2239.t1 [Chlamydomonas eustigma]
MQWISSAWSPKNIISNALGLKGSSDMSGGETREDGLVSFGYSLMKGKRPNMEDFYHAEFKKDSRCGEVIGFFGVFDGHGGPNAAHYVKTNLFNNLLQHAKFPSDMQAAVSESYTATDEQYMRQDAGSKREDGCTAVTLIVYQHRLIIANVGDSRAVLCRGGEAIAVSVDHKPNLKEERERIEAAGGVVIWAGTWRVAGVLAVSRAFGDKPLKRFVISTPYMQEEQLRHEDEFLILASDGLWDVFTNEDAVALARSIEDPEQAAKKLTEEAYSRGSMDNITCIVIKFKH